MALDNAVKRLEQGTYRSLFDDGLVDLFIGAFVAAMGFARLTDADIAPAIVGATAAPLWLAIRRFWIEPRAGAATLSRQRVLGLRTRIGAMSMGLAAAAVVGVGLLSWSRTGIDAIPGGGLLLPLGVGAIVVIAGVLLDFPRAILYGAILPMAKIGGELAGIPRGWELLCAGGVIALVGTVLLVRFLAANRPLAGSLDDVG